MDGVGVLSFIDFNYLLGFFFGFDVIVNGIDIEYDIDIVLGFCCNLDDDGNIDINFVIIK